MRKFNKEIAMDFIDPNILLLNEIFKYVTPDIVPGVYPYYMVSNCGRIYHRYLERIMSPGLETSGYLFILLSTEFGQKTIQVNRLVLITFCPIQNPEMYQANHKNGNKLNNHLSNLEWTTRSENIIHSYRTGLHISPTSITQDQAIKIVEMLIENKYMCKEIASILGVSVNIVESIKKKESWKHLTEGLTFEQRKGRLYTDNDVKILCEYFQNNPKCANELSSDYVRKALRDCNFENPDSMYDTARKIYSKKHYTHISKYYNF